MCTRKLRACCILDDESGRIHAQQASRVQSGFASEEALGARVHQCRELDKGSFVPPRCGFILSLFCSCATRRKLQTPGTAEEHTRQETPTSNPIDRQPTHLIDQAPGTIEMQLCQVTRRRHAGCRWTHRMRAMYSAQSFFATYTLHQQLRHAP